jgi:HSP20 family protein
MEKKKGKKSRQVVSVRRTRALAPAERREPGLSWAREVGRIFDDFERRLRWPPRWGPEWWWPAGEMSFRAPVVDVFEKENEVIIKAEIPGLSKDDVEVNLTNSTLTISGEKKKEEEVKDRDYYRCERSFGSFSRTIELPAEVKTEEAKASFKDGLLEIHLPKTEAAKRKLIKVKVG